MNIRRTEQEGLQCTRGGQEQAHVSVEKQGLYQVTNIEKKQIIRYTRSLIGRWQCTVKVKGVGVCREDVASQSRSARSKEEGGRCSQLPRLETAAEAKAVAHSFTGTVHRQQSSSAAPPNETTATLAVQLLQMRNCNIDFSRVKNETSLQTRLTSKRKVDAARWKSHSCPCRCWNADHEPPSAAAANERVKHGGKTRTLQRWPSHRPHHPHPPLPPSPRPSAPPQQHPPMAM